MADFNTYATSSEPNENTWVNAQIAAYVRLPGSDGNWTNGIEKTLDIFTRLNIDKTNNYDWQDAVTMHNIGYAKLPSRVTFEIVAPAYSKSVRILSELKDAETRFVLGYYDINGIENGEGNKEYKLSKQELVGCVLEGENHTYETEGPPPITFTGKALGHRRLNTSDDKFFNTLGQQVDEVFDSSSHEDFRDDNYNIW